MASSGPGGDRQEFDWDLPINVPTIGVHRTLRVTSNESVGAVMIKLASKLGEEGTGRVSHETRAFLLFTKGRVPIVTSADGLGG